MSETAVNRISSAVTALDNLYLNWNTSNATVEDLNALKAQASEASAELGIPFIYNPPISAANVQLIEAGEYTLPENDEEEAYEDEYYESSEYYDDSDY